MHPIRLDGTADAAALKVDRVFGKRTSLIQSQPNECWVDTTSSIEAQAKVEEYRANFCRRTYVNADGQQLNDARLRRARTARRGKSCE